MTEPARAIPPICRGCGRFLRSTDEQARGHCARCPPPAAPARGSAPRCCESEPACLDCPYQSGWSEQA